MSVLVLAEWVRFRFGAARSERRAESHAHARSREPEPPSASPAAADLAPAARLERVRRRDPDALEAFFAEHFPRVFSLASRLLGNRDEAEDLTQEVFYRTYRAIDRLDPDRDPVPWLMKITYNVCRDYWRSPASSAGRRAVSLDAEPGRVGDVADTSPGPAEQLEALRRAATVQAALLELGAESRMVVLLHDYQGMTHEEIAGVMGISAAAARKRYSRAIAELRHRLQGDEG